MLALKAILAYERFQTSLLGSGSLALSIDGNKVQAIEYGSSTSVSSSGLVFDESLIVPLLKPGREHEFSFSLHPDSASPETSPRNISLPVSVSLRMNVLQPPSSLGVPVHLNVKLSKPVVSEGDILTLEVTLSNVEETGKELPMVAASIGIPGGLEPRIEKLKELKASGEIAMFELMNGNLVLYWRGMGPKQVNVIRVDVVAAVPGQYTGAASVAYLYYTNELKSFSPGVAVEINGKSTL